MRPDGLDHRGEPARSWQGRVRRRIEGLQLRPRGPRLGHGRSRNRSRGRGRGGSGPPPGALVRGARLAPGRSRPPAGRRQSAPDRPRPRLRRREPLPPALGGGGREDRRLLARSGLGMRDLISGIAPTWATKRGFGEEADPGVPNFPAQPGKISPGLLLQYAIFRPGKAPRGGDPFQSPTRR